jgi:nitroreductase
MNETLNAILTRRSIRNYKQEQIPDDTLKQIINAGIHAPSAMGRQPWHLVVVRGLEKIAEVDREMKAATARMPDNPYREYVSAEKYSINFRSAPTFMIVSGDIVLSPRNAAIDCALVLGNMFLAAHSFGIGSCWINQLNVLNDEPGFREYMTRLGIPSENRIFGCACLGYPDGSIKQAAPRKEGNVVFIG